MSEALLVKFMNSLGHSTMCKVAYCHESCPSRRAYAIAQTEIDFWRTIHETSVQELHEHIKRAYENAQRDVMRRLHVVLAQFESVERGGHDQGIDPETGRLV